LLQEYGGTSWINEEEYLVGAAELFAEIAYSTQSIDMHLKKRNYKEAGVVEYLVVCIADQEVHWFDFRSGTRISPTRQRTLRSRIFPGLWIDGPALLARDSKKLIATAERGLASREHAAFVKRLQAFKRKKH